MNTFLLSKQLHLFVTAEYLEVFGALSAQSMIWFQINSKRWFLSAKSHMETVTSGSTSSCDLFLQLHCLTMHFPRLKKLGMDTMSPKFWILLQGFSCIGNIIKSKVLKWSETILLHYSNSFQAAICFHVYFLQCERLGLQLCGLWGCENRQGVLWVRPVSPGAGARASSALGSSS